MITINTPWRTLGDMDYTQWSEGSLDGSPEFSSRESYLAAKPHSILAFAMGYVESKLGMAFNQNKRENKNFLNLRPPNGVGYLKFSTVADGIQEYVERITSPTYKNGIYAGTVTILDLIQVYAPVTDNNDPEEYAKEVARIANRFRKVSPVALTFGNIKHPPFLDRLIPDSETGAYDNLGPVKPVGVCQHSMVGTLWGTDGWFRRGRGVSTGLTHYGIGGSTDGPNWDGKILRWNDPRGRATHVNYTDLDGKRHQGKVSAHRSGWANGGSDGLEGDGPLFVRTFGIGGINRNLVSIERSDGGNTNTPMSPKQFESICLLSAYWFDQAKVPWDVFPMNPAYDVVTHLLHFEFATKNCAFPPVNGRIDEIQARIRAIMKAAQLKTADEGQVDPEIPPDPDHNKWPYPLDDLKEQFGTFNFLYKSGKTKEAGWDDQGAISNAWAARAAMEKISKVSNIPPPLVGMEAKDREGNIQTTVMFDLKGTNVWMLHRAVIGANWTWVK